MDILPTNLTENMLRNRQLPEALAGGREERGLYLQLLHGRKDPNQDMDDWGESGPALGPFKWAHFTYLNFTTLGWEGGEMWMDDNFSADACHLLLPNSLCRHDDMLFWNGVFYGDWEFIWR